MCSPPETDRWFYKNGDRKCGPVSTAELSQLFATRAIPAASLVWRFGMETWKPAVEVADFRVARLADSFSAPIPSVRRPRRFVLPLTMLLMAACSVAAFIASRSRPGPTQPGSLQERLIIIGRSADLSAMPTVIDAIVDPDKATSSIAVAVAERLLGVRYSDADRTNPAALAGQIAADWNATREQMRRRHTRQGFTHP